MRTFINPDQNIVQIDSKVYIIPSASDFIEQNRQGGLICKEVMRLAIEKRPKTEECYPSCPVYHHSKDLFKTVGSSQLCDYQGEVDLIQVVTRKPTRLLPTSRLNPKLEYMVALDSCVIMDSFFEILQQRGILDEFLVLNATPEKYPTVSEVYGNLALELMLSNEYKLLKKRQNSIG
jgi:hypothetical protein